jgi:hypothetical protein
MGKGEAAEWETAGGPGKGLSSGYASTETGAADDKGAGGGGVSAVTWQAT